MSRSLARVREMVADHEAGWARRYPDSVQRVVVRYAQARRAEGASWPAIAAELGLWFETLRRWCARAQPSASEMMPVEIVDDERSSSAVVIVSPSGFRLVGLDAAQAVAALKALG